MHKLHASCHVMVRGQLLGRGIHDGRVIRAIHGVPRHAFVPEPQRRLAYEDCAVPIGEHQTVSQPYIVALMLEALGLKGTERVLEVGTGSGYMTALLARLAGRVFTVERVPALYERSGALLERMGCLNVERRLGDGSLGWPSEAPFDAIIAGAAAPRVPDPFLEQLREGGVLVAPVGARKRQWLVRVDKTPGGIRSRPVTPCVFVPLLGTQAFSPQSGGGVVW